MLKFKGIEVFYGHLQALRGVSLDVNQGEIITIVGSNGAGKSTTLMAISGVLKPPRYEHYGLAVMLADLTWIWASWRLENGYLALGGYVGAAPRTHAIMGNPRSAWISGGLRAGALALTAGATIQAARSNCFDCTTGIPLVVLSLVGAGTVVVTDWVVLARREVPRRDALRREYVPMSDEPPDWAVQPNVQATQGGLRSA